MTGQKKIIVIIVILAVVFIIFMVTGTYLDREPRPEPDKETAESYENNKWKKRLEKPISMFTPSLYPKDFLTASSLQNKCKFTISKDEDTSFRSLNLLLETLPGAAGSAKCEVSYQVEESAVDKLKNQSETLEGETNTTTIVVQKGGGDLELRLEKGVKVSMKYGRNSVWLCKRSTGGTVSVNPRLGQ
ncbi:MAG: hypothetical protein K9J85_06870 [Desulfobacteraceae bacterium]|nr:hypothetical protein [Desulfobacteraceae bacterium]